MSIQTKILAVIHAASEPMTNRQVREALGLTGIDASQTTSAALFALAQKKQLIKVTNSDGKPAYGAASDAPAIVAPAKRGPKPGAIKARTKSVPSAHQAPPQASGEESVEVDQPMSESPTRQLCALLLLEPRPLTESLREAIAACIREAA